MNALKNEIVFWTGIMRDHAMFQINALAPSETSSIEQSTCYYLYFKNIHEKVKATENMESLLPEIKEELNGFIAYKKELLSKLQQCKILLNLSPSLINHQILEALEFQNTLNTFKKDARISPYEFACMLKMWISDGMAHASALMVFLDPSEGLYKDEAEKFKMAFEKLLLKAMELEMSIANTGMSDGLLEQTAGEAVQLLECFTEFCKKIKKLRMQCRIMGMGTFLPLLPDHLNREHRYFIHKIQAWH